MKKNVIFLFIFIFLSAMCLNMGHSVTPSYLNNLGFKDEYFGYMFSAMSLGHVIFAPIWGNLGDKFGRKHIIMIGFIGYAISQFIFVNVSIVPLLIFVRFTAGAFGNSVVSSTLVYITESTSKEERTKYLSIYAALFAGGGSTAYLFGGNIGEYLSVKETFYTQVIFSLILFVFVLFFFKNIKVKQNEKKKGIISNFKELSHVGNKNTLLMFFVLVLVSISHTNISKFLDKYIIDLGYSKSSLGTFVFVTGIVGILSNFIIVPILIKKYKEMNILIVSLFLSPIFIFLTFIQPNIMAGLYSVFMLYVSLMVFYEPLNQSYISKQTEENYGTVMGLRWSFRSIGSVVGPLIGGFIYAYKPEFVFYFSGLLLILSAFILTVGIKRQS